jgi:isocitrate/isopropylmalate dehydrogenase
MQLVRDPGRFDVLLIENMFGGGASVSTSEMGSAVAARIHA